MLTIAAAMYAQRAPPATSTSIPVTATTKVVWPLG